MALWIALTLINGKQCFSLVVQIAFHDDDRVSSSMLGTVKNQLFAYVKAVMVFLILYSKGFKTA